ncbi:MAG: hypothetical protein ACE363_05940 [Alphaproteobacteria bacterium]
MRRHWLVVNDVTGEIIETHTNASDRPPRVPVGHSAVKADDHRVTCDDHYVDGGTVKDRPDMPVTVRELSGEVEIDAPEDADVAFGGKRFKGGKGKRRESMEPGTRQMLFVRRFPYKDVTLIFGQRPTTEDREADLAKVGDPRIREFLRKYVK